MQKYFRSTVAQGDFESVARRKGLADEIVLDATGTHGLYHAGESPDPWVQEARSPAAQTSHGLG